jgi:hypothetical protein
MLRSAANSAMHTVQSDCPVSHAYELFCTMGMRHLVVIAIDGTVDGMLTRKDLCHIPHQSHGDHDHDESYVEDQNNEFDLKAQFGLGGYDLDGGHKPHQESVETIPCSETSLDET